MSGIERPMEREVVHPDVDFATDLLPHIQELTADLRERDRFFPVMRHAEKALLVTRFDDVSFAFGDEKDIPLHAGAKRFAEPAQGRSLFSMTGDEHRTHRALVSSAFTASAIDRYERDLMAPEARSALGKLTSAGGGTVDLIGDFAEMYGISVIVRILGLPVEDDRKFKRWAHDLTASSWALEDAMKASREFEDYVTPIIHERRRGTGGDFLSRLARAEVDGERLKDVDIVSFLRVLFPAGADTTFRQLGNFIMAMLTVPGLKTKLKRIVADPCSYRRGLEMGTGHRTLSTAGPSGYRMARSIYSGQHLSVAERSVGKSRPAHVRAARGIRSQPPFEENHDIRRRDPLLHRRGSGQTGDGCCSQHAAGSLSAIELAEPETTRITGATLRGPATLMARLGDGDGGRRHSTKTIALIRRRPSLNLRPVSRILRDKTCAAGDTACGVHEICPQLSCHIGRAGIRRVVGVLAGRSSGRRRARLFPVRSHIARGCGSLRGRERVPCNSRRAAGCGGARGVQMGPARRYALMLTRPPDISHAAFITFVNNWALRLFSGNSLRRVTLDIVRPYDDSIFPADAIVSLWPNENFDDAGLGTAPAVIALAGILPLDVYETPRATLTTAHPQFDELKGRR